MGLDMYLWTNSKKVCRAANKAIGGEEWRIPYGDAIYWRKANAIHRWFVEHVQGGDDDCGIYDVSVEQLMELRKACGEVLMHPERAEEVLPTLDGFFFGGTEYDEWYFDDLKRTVKGIDAILWNVEPYDQHSVANLVWKSWREKGDPDEWNVVFHYHSSW